MFLATNLIGFGAKRRSGGVPTTPALVDRTTGTAFGNVTNGAGLAGCFDGDTSKMAADPASYSSGATGYVGKEYSPAKYINKIVAYGSSNDGYNYGVPPATITLKIYAKNGAPSSGTDGTELGTLSFTDAGDESGGRTVTSTDQATPYTHVWCYGSMPSGQCMFAQLEIWELV